MGKYVLYVVNPLYYKRERGRGGWRERERERERDKSEDTSFAAVPQQILTINVCPSAVGYSDS